MQHSEAVAKQIEARITELRQEITAHERALEALKGPKPRTARRARSNGAQSQANGARRSSPKSTRGRAVASADAVFDALKDGADQAAVIAKQFGVSTSVVRSRLQQLEQAGRVSRTGNRRSTRWRSHSG
jgi:predicted Rossmann fold nucleotide-binding protein DprA/Smf involved in DNA uptake